MNPTDRKIAELKGLPAEGEITHWPVGEDDKGRVFPTGDPSPQNWGWSISDSKALELVDELIKVEANKPAREFVGPPSLGFSITRERGSGAYSAHLSVSDSNGENTEWHAGAAATRPEAICRAYIAAREWMAAQGGGRVGAGGFGS
jgi:hypothetical protein